MATKRLAVLTICLAGALGPGPAGAALEKEHAELDALLAQRKYASAARYVDARPELRGDPRFLRRLSHVLVSFYAHTVNFAMFAVKDLAPGEDLAKVRGAPGQSELIGGDWEQALHDALARWPEDPDVLLAVGEYLSRAAACRCARPRLFVGAAADDYPYLERAHRAGVFDAWSLFRLGVHHLSADPPDLRRAVELLDASLKLDPEHVPARYDAAIARFQLGEVDAALAHSAKALGRYGDRDLDADTYNLHARILRAKADPAGAAAAFRRALELRPAHPHAFTGLLGVLREQERLDEYRRVASAFIALDHANTYPFGVYLEFVQEAGIVEADRELARELAGRRWSNDREIGAVYYSLGHLAEMDADRALAHRHYTRSLAALRKLRDPPPRSIEVLGGLVERTAPER